MLQHVLDLDMRNVTSASTAVSGRSAQSDQVRWRRVLARDRSADGEFFYAVTSTGVFCRPSCPSRRPRPDRVRFFDDIVAAAAAGFRPCRRCRPTEVAANGTTDAIRRVAAYLDAHAEDVVPLSRLGRVAGLSPSHLQRRFKQELGLSPREYQAARRADRFRRELRAGKDVTTAIYEAGYGSPSRVYEANPTGRGVSPGAYRRGGEGLEVGYAIVPSPLGRLLVAATSAGVCAVKLGDRDDALRAELSREFPSAKIVGPFDSAVPQTASLRAGQVAVPSEWLEAVVARIGNIGSAGDLPLDVKGTAFQWRVWRALQQIPFGETRSYSDVAREVGSPSAVRAVARACATNPVALVVPCHRVVGKDGAMTGYRWGVERKKKLLALERDRSLRSR
jgi:AraC family transcriptional regulator of adaptative response/methylated-DNA-[protein]-cysteine methyltransferase